MIVSAPPEVVMGSQVSMFIISHLVGCQHGPESGAWANNITGIRRIIKLSVGEAPKGFEKSKSTRPAQMSSDT